MVFDLFYTVFGILTEVSDLIGFSFRFKEGNIQKQTQSVTALHGQAARDRDCTFSKRLKTKGLKTISREINIANNLQR